jgi:hypothetical protein
MDNWDEAAADAAVAALARSTKPDEIYELFYRYGARDYRSIGHKAIFVASSQRTLEYIGWQYAEPVLRSLAYALLMHEDGNPAKRDGAPDRSWRRNQKLASKIRAGWSEGKPKPEATRELLEVLRGGSDEDASQAVVGMLNQKISPQSIWDAVFAGAGELLLRQPGIVALHSATTTNAVHYAFRTSRDDLTRRLLLLQNAAFLPQFRESMRQRGRVRDVAIDRLEPLEPKRTGAEAVEEILSDVSRDRMTAARKTLGYLGSGGETGPLITAARRALILHGDGAHDYKFGSAVLEDYEQMSPAMQHHFLAASMMQLCGSGDPESDLVERTRSALQD